VQQQTSTTKCKIIPSRTGQKQRDIIFLKKYNTNNNQNTTHYKATAQQQATNNKQRTTSNEQQRTTRNNNEPLWLANKRCVFVRVCVYQFKRESCLPLHLGNHGGFDPVIRRTALRGELCLSIYLLQFQQQKKAASKNK